ncbi:hypothetical protein BDR07DRAFT_1373994 [Suillus spraguei]|nr:hypothetical protein BDR07DRAFT_1373994 [Suillus spraguei]
MVKSPVRFNVSRKRGYDHLSSGDNPFEDNGFEGFSIITSRTGGPFTYLLQIIPRSGSNGSNIFGEGNIEVAISKFETQHACNEYCKWPGFGLEAFLESMLTGWFHDKQLIPYMSISKISGTLKDSTLFDYDVDDAATVVSNTTNALSAPQNNSTMDELLEQGVVGQVLWEENSLPQDVKSILNTNFSPEYLSKIHYSLSDGPGEKIKRGSVFCPASHGMGRVWQLNEKNVQPTLLVNSRPRRKQKAQRWQKV